MSPIVDTDHTKPANSLSLSQRAYLIRTAKSAGLALLQLATETEKAGPDLDIAFSHRLLLAAEGGLGSCATALGLVLETVRARAALEAELRVASQRITGMLLAGGQHGPATATATGSAFLGDLSSRARRWWAHEGLGYLSALQFQENGARMTLSCQLSDALIVDESLDCELGERLDALKEKGLDFDREPGGYDYLLPDTDENRARLVELIHASLPTARVLEVTTRSGRGEGASRHVGEIHVYLGDLGALAALPASIEPESLHLEDPLPGKPPCTPCLTPTTPSSPTPN